MAAIGTIVKAVNSQAAQLYVGSIANNWALLQNARMLVSHPIFREPTTDAGVALFTGAPDVSISGSLLFTQDNWNDANGIAAQLLKSATTGEVPASEWGIRFTGQDGVAFNLSTTGGKFSVADISKSVEGGVKVDISIILPSIVAIS
jgi:hypothetical protein